MNTIEKVKNLIRVIPYRFRTSDEPDVERDVDTVAREICQLFPRSESNPDGYKE